MTSILTPKDKRECATSQSPPCKCCYDPRCRCCGNWLESYCDSCMEKLEEECSLDDERESPRSTQAYYFKDGYGNTVEDTDDAIGKHDCGGSLDVKRFNDPEVTRLHCPTCDEYYWYGEGVSQEDTEKSNVYRYKDIYGNDVTDVYTVSKPERVQYFDH